jgi:hypothetical protein
MLVFVAILTLESLAGGDFGLMLEFERMEERLGIRRPKGWHCLVKLEHQHYLYFDLHTWDNVIARY